MPRRSASIKKKNNTNNKRHADGDVTESLLGKGKQHKGAGVGAKPFGGLVGNVPFFSFYNIAYWIVAVLPLVVGAASLALVFVGHMRVNNDVDHLTTRVDTIDTTVTNDINPALVSLSNTCFSPNRYLFNSVQSFYVV